MTKKEIKQLYRDEKAKAKRNYKNHLADAEELYHDRLAEFYAVKGKKPPQNPPKRPLLEEIGNAITHGLGAVFAIVALILMLLSADRDIEVVSAVIYFFGMFVMFMSSCLYHAFVYGSGVKRLFHRFDYSSIYLLIGATFAPVLLCYFGDMFGTIFFAVQWAIIACGISLVGVFGPKKLSFVHIPLYVILGWSALMLLPRLISGNLPLALWILGGGVLYTVGILPLLLNKKVSHFIWHFFVLAGAVVQWIGIYVYLF
ncbi:MAG: hemolysin III family protein [Clostridia bacterium]|nr:hemolysin III family protein [Clostridia bacterium]